MERKTDCRYCGRELYFVESFLNIDLCNQCKRAKLRAEQEKIIDKVMEEHAEELAREFEKKNTNTWDEKKMRNWKRK